jgi:hypothetical protein
VQVADAGGGMPIGMIDLPGARASRCRTCRRCSARCSAAAEAAEDDGGRGAQALTKEEADKLLDQDALTRDAVANAENNGIVFLDEIDKVCARTSEGGFRGGDVSREGVQRDLLPLIEGTTVTTKHGPVKTDHILFIASGAFHLAKPSDLLPELQGRLPIRVELKPLTRDDFRRILTEPEHSLLKQYVALLGTEGVTLDFTEDAVDALADLAAEINARSRTSARGAWRRCWSGCWRRSPSPRATARARRCTVDAAAASSWCAAAWRRWRRAPISAASSCPGAMPSDWFHRGLAAATGAVGGAFGLPGTLAELPVTTTVLLRQIAAIAAENGEDLSSPEAAAECLKVFALGGRSAADDAAESGYFAVRVALTEALRGMVGRALLPGFLAQVAARFGIPVTIKISAQALPVIGAAAGAAINLAFLEHFRSVAQGHFAVRRLERTHGAAVVRQAWDRLRATKDEPFLPRR